MDVERKDPRLDCRMPPSGRVTMFHASEALATMLKTQGIRAPATGEIWLATQPDIVELQRGVGRNIRSLAIVTVLAERLAYERSHDDVHLFYQLDGDPLDIVAIADVP